MERVAMTGNFVLSNTKRMKTTPTIAVIGATGNMGSAISRNLAKGNYRLLLFSTKPEDAERVANDIITANPKADVEAIPCSREVRWEADIIILAVPHHLD